ncbi:MULTISPECIES: hypothetical protein [Okeania]|uniref:hypothetical protein n=1 Tax=Okeania TaxID=1458928 RepID=UPI000F5393D3|nr:MULTISPECIES: hypothetical protein [Okeania]NET80036.1 hypothetical protein [Okeania sp. SIO1F9]RQH18608.1 hypothetical protein D4Z78_14980 [Okeania hirsuta]
MESFSIIDTVVNELKQDGDLIRIKKVIYCACEGRWENDETKLEEINLKELIEELYQKTGNIETLDHRLSRIVSKVNKKTEYGLLAQKIIESVGKLYPEEEEDMTIMESSPIWGLQGDSGEQITLKDRLVVEESYERDPGKLFDVRQKIMEGTNPLKTKILIFSIVEHQFNFGERDWLLLKTKNLDSLIRQIFNLCLSITDLESSLYSMANNFESPDEYVQVANVIINALSTCYSSEIILPTNSQVQVEDSEQKISNPENNSAFQKGNFFTQESSSISSFENSQTKRIHQKNNQQKAKNVTDSIEPQQIIPSVTIQPKIDSQGQEQTDSIERKNILDSIKQKLEIEHEISTLVNQSVDTVMDTVETQFISLEETLNHLLQSELEEQRLLLKYTALENLISNIQDQSTKFKEILKQLEIEERKKLNFSNSSNTNSTELEQKKESVDENQQKILELATQGNPKAVALIIHQLLQQQEIKIIAGRRNAWLHLILESEQIPNQEMVTSLVQQKIASLKSESLKNVKIHGRKLGEKSIAWTQTIEC